MSFMTPDHPFRTLNIHLLLFVAVSVALAACTSSRLSQVEADLDEGGFDGYTGDDSGRGDSLRIDIEPVARDGSSSLDASPTRDQTVDRSRPFAPDSDMGGSESDQPEDQPSIETVSGSRIQARWGGPVQVDGVLEEWGADAAVELRGDNVEANGGRNWNVGDRSDLDARVSVRWDANHLYLGAQVVDDDHDHEAPAGQWWEADSVSLFFDLDDNREGSSWRPGDNIFAFIADPAERAGSNWWRKGSESGAVEHSAPPTVFAATALTATGYTLEAAIPLSVLTENNRLRFPREVGFTILVTDAGGGWSQLMWVGRGDDQSGWGRLVFERYLDQDGDGWPSVTDCDDGAAAVHPYATEVARNDRDEDCDGEDSEDEEQPDPVDPIDPVGPVATMADFWAGRAHFRVDQNPVPVANPTSGHREAFAVNRTDISPSTVYLYHRCFVRGGANPSICLSVSNDGGATFPHAHGEVIAPEDGHIFAVAGSVTEYNGRWYMAYEESNIAAVYWAESDDGLSWQRNGQLIAHGRGGAWDQGAGATPGLAELAGRLYVFYASFPLGGENMDIGYVSGTSMDRLSKSDRNPVFRRASSGWDSGQVSMPRVIQQGDYYYLFYEGAAVDFTCGPHNRYGWGIARSTDLQTWERFAGNPMGLSDRVGTGCGNDMPSPFVRYDGRIFVYHTSGDTRRIIREALVMD